MLVSELQQAAEQRQAQAAAAAGSRRVSKLECTERSQPHCQRACAQRSTSLVLPLQTTADDQHAPPHWSRAACAHALRLREASLTWNALTRRSVSSTLRPTGRSLTVFWRSVPSGAMMNRPLRQRGSIAAGQGRSTLMKASARKRGTACAVPPSRPASRALTHTHPAQLQHTTCARCAEAQDGPRLSAMRALTAAPRLRRRRPRSALRSLAQSAWSGRRPAGTRSRPGRPCCAAC